MKLSCLCILGLCRLNFQSLSPYRRWIPIPKAFVRNLAHKLHASGTMFTWSFFRKLIISNVQLLGSILLSLLLDHASQFGVINYLTLDVFHDHSSGYAPSLCCFLTPHLLFCFESFIHWTFFNFYWIENL